MVELRRLLVDARAIHHHTAGGRGIGNYTLGLLRGLAEVGAPLTALVTSDDDAVALRDVVGPAAVGLWRRDVIHAHVDAGTWYVATGLYLPPISFDPIPAVITETQLPVVGVMYDVIPHRHPDVYLINEVATRQTRLRGLLARTVDLTAAISKFSADTATAELRLDAAHVSVIGAGVESRFVPPAQRTLSRRPTVVAVTGPDPRKNTEGLLRAWALVPPEVRTRHRLFVISGGPPDLLSRWRELASEVGLHEGVEFTGAVSEDRMVELLQQAELVVQPSLEEGFGLTVVEAAACGAAVICSNVSALPEVLDEPAATFDPGDPRDLAGAIAKALSDDDHRAVLREAGRRAVERWRWDRVATDMLAAIAEFGDPPPPPREPRRRVAVVTRCAGSDWERDVETDVVRSLRETAEADIVELVDTAGTSAVVQPDPAGATWPAAALGRYVKYHEFDHVVALIDRWDSHAVAVRIARQYPVHVWLCGSVEAQVPPDIHPRSMIVESLPEAEAVRQTATAPVLVLPSSTSTSGWSAADTARALDHWLTVGHRTDETITVVGPADTLM